MDRQQAIERVRKLAMVTVENGATEGEERNATDAGKRLIARFELTYRDVVETPEPEPWTQEYPYGVRPESFPGASGVRVYGPSGLRVIITFD